ncbi:MAG: lysophospholipid acyltransferase family protein [Bacteroidales bacterium]|nr:lysophospholipid acyltransferase family protein [Bacteroidales bacterium]
MTSIELRAKIAGGCLSFCGKLPLKCLYGIGGAVSWFMDHVMDYRKGVIYANIASAFPEKHYSEIESIARDYYSRIGDLLAEAIWFGGCPGNGKKLRKQRIYEYTNPEVLLDIQEKTGVMAMKSHCGNWELFGGIYDYLCNPDFEARLPKERVFVAYRPLRNKVSDIVFYENRRAPLPDYQGQIEDSRLMRHAVSNRTQRPVYILNADQYPYQACHFVGNFLNQPTQGMLGGFSLAAKLGFAVLYMREERAGRGHYRLTFEVITENAKGQDPEELMRKYYSLLEADIRKDPVNWLWSHKRWRK